MPSSRKYEASFLTATILDWQFLLADNRYKDIITGSLQHFAENNKALIHAFVIMDNHLHLIWQAIHPHTQEGIQKNFLKYTSQMIVNDLRHNDPKLLEQFYIGLPNTQYRLWERHSLAIDIWSESVLKQKLDYIHNNPVKAGICDCPENYKYSSASVYAGGNNWTFLTPFFFTS